MKSCPQCGYDNDNQARYCGRCGSPLSNPQGQWEETGDWAQSPAIHKETVSGRVAGMVYPDQCRLSPWSAAFASMMVCGLGQLVNGQISKGIVIFFSNYLLFYLFDSLWISFFYQLAMIVDAYLCAATLHLGRPIGRFAFFGQ